MHDHLVPTWRGERVAHACLAGKQCVRLFAVAELDDAVPRTLAAAQESQGQRDERALQRELAYLAATECERLRGQLETGDATAVLAGVERFDREAARSVARGIHGWVAAV